MSKIEAQPWRRLPASLADVLRPEIGPLAGEILAAIAEEVPEYARPFEGSFGRGIRRGVDEALRQFLELIENPGSDREQGREIYLALGRGELRQGRSLDSLQAAYRVGARVAWRRLAQVGLEAGLDSPTLCILADAIFAYIDELSAESVEGYAQAQSAEAGERDRRRDRLVTLLAEENPDPARAAAAAEEADWEPPEKAAALACNEADLGRLLRRLPAGAIGTAVGGHGCVVVPDPDGPGRRKLVDRAVASSSAALGQTVAWTDFSLSWQRALLALDAATTRDVARLLHAGPEGLLRSDDHLLELALHGSRDVLADLERRHLAALDGMTPKSRERTLQTLRAYLAERGSVPRMAERLHLHPQTVRYRLARLREVFGDRLESADFRFEVEAVLRRAHVG